MYFFPNYKKNLQKSDGFLRYVALLPGQGLRRPGGGGAMY